MSDAKLTHGDLVARAARWLRGTRQCRCVLTEIISQANESPDAIGWSGGGATILVECKTSVEDFLGDARKLFRWRPASGMGNRRYYMTEPGLIKPADLPPLWGLLEVHGRQVRTKVQSRQFLECNTRAEMYMLLSELSLYQKVARGGHLIPTRRALRIYKEMNVEPPKD